MRETQILDRIRKLAQSGYCDKAIIQGIGDDCAILRPAANEDLVLTSDFVLEGRHFTLKTHTASDIGRKALARSLSDLAAMGSEPVFCLISLAIPAQLASSWVPGFYKGLLALAAKYKVTIAGGDLARFDKVIADVMCCGRVPRGEAILRSGAKPGDRIYVTGELGRSADPRIKAGIALRKLGVSAAMDISDGLSLDLHRLCLESQVSADLNANLPIAPGATIEQALHAGEDYELLFTASPKKKIPKKIGGLPITPIGIVTARNPGRVRFNGHLLQPRGFDHFSQNPR
ncbi:MAG: thiamine-phosphate kinase [Bryobacteraceae bacterium]